MLLVRITPKKNSKTPEQIASARCKAKRRFLRHLKGKEIRHRVVEKTPTCLELAFFRRSGETVRIRYSKKPEPKATFKGACKALAKAEKQADRPEIKGRKTRELKKGKK